MTLLFFEHNGLVSVIHSQEHKYPTRDAQRKACQRLGRERQSSGVRLLWERRGVPQAAQPHQHRLSASHRQQAPKLVPTVLAYPHSVLPLYGVTLCSEGQVLSGAKHMQPLWRAHVNPHWASHAVLCWGFSLPSGNLSRILSLILWSGVRAFLPGSPSSKREGAF